MTTSARATAALGGLDATLAVARVTLVRAMRNKSLWVAAFIAFLPEVFAGVNREWRLAVGQEIYTPEDVSQRAAVLDDRPYAGWLHLGLSLVRRRPRSLLTEQFGLDLDGAIQLGDDG